MQLGLGTVAPEPGARLGHRVVKDWYQAHLERLHDDARVRQADLVQLARLAHESPSR